MDSIKKLLQNYKLQFMAVIVLTVLFTVRSYAKTLGQMTVSIGYVKWISIITIIVGTALVIGVAYVTLLRDAKIERVYPLLGMSLGILFILVIPTYTTPDETYHFCGAYNVSNDMLGIEHPEKERDMLARACDSEQVNTSFKAGAYKEWDGAFRRDVDTSLTTKFDYSSGEVSYPSYFIPALGITLGRLLHLNFPMMAMLGTFFNLAWFVFWMTYALKKLPFGKRLLVTVLLLPLTLQEVSSFSRDNPLLASAVLVVALTLHWKYSKEKVKVSEIIVFAVSSYVLITVKSALYAYLVLFVLFVLMNPQWFAGGRKKIAIGGAVVVVILALVFLFPMHGWDRVMNILGTEFYQENTEQYGHSIWYYMTHLGELFAVYFNTIKVQGQFYIYEMTGNGLGWLEIGNSILERIIYIALVVVAMIRTEKDALKMGIQTRVFCILFGIAGVCLCLFAMLLFWTPEDHIVIDGVQGRYFLPILFPILLGVGYWGKPVLKIEMDRYYPVALSGMGYLMAIHVIQYNVQLM